jgi:signal-transduction protein with cAMP-binding, CBS, and nucleotidyltransferase domain
VANYNKIMTSIPPTPQAPQQVVGELLSRLLEQTRYLDSSEILQFLTAFQTQLAEEIRQIESFSDLRGQLLAEISECRDYARLGVLHQELNELEMEEFLKVQSVATLHHNCTEYRDLLTERAVRLVEEEFRASGKGSPPAPYALLSTGSDGRDEQTLITDQDHLIVYGDEGGDETDSWFTEFSLLLVDRLEELGFKKCTGDMMPSNPTWRGSYHQWRRRITSIVRYECNPEDFGKNMMNLIVLSDARHVAGDRVLADRLVETIREVEQEYFQALWGMAKAATEMKLALGFLKRLWTEASGEHKGSFNLKLIAWAPLIMNVRILAINQGIPATNTIRRIELLQQEKSFSPAVAAGLIDAYEVLTRHRILLQIRVIKGIQKDSYYLNPYELATDEREKIRQALLRIEELQKTIHTNFSIM